MLDSVLCHLVGYEAVVGQHRVSGHVADGSVETRLLGLDEQHLHTGALHRHLRFLIAAVLYCFTTGFYMDAQFGCFT